MLKLSVFMSPTGAHVGGWRHPDASTDAGYAFEPWLGFVKLLERGKFDMMFLADGNGVNGVTTPDLLAANPTLRPVVIEPISLLAALAPHTTRLGLVATATTTYDEPFSVARRFASLDLLSGGRGGWNVVTSSNAEDALNFNRDEHVERADRFERAEEFVDVVKGLWNSWDADAFVRNKETGQFLDATKVRMLNHAGKHFKVRGPLNAARSPQGQPVIVVAGASDQAKELAARTADIVFTVNETKESALAFYADVKGRMAKYGRAPEQLKVLPGASVFVGKSAAEAEKAYSDLQALIPDKLGVALLSRLLSADLSQHDVDGPMPEIEGEVRGIGSFRAMIIEMAKREKLSIRETYQRVLPARGHVLMKGDAAQIADQMQDWYESKACDGFNLVASHLPGGLESIVEHLIPELQRRNLFRKEYEGATLRENLGLSLSSAARKARSA